MNVLVDYDNIRQQHRGKGLVYIADRVLQAIAAVQGGVLSRVRNDRSRGTIRDPARLAALARGDEETRRADGHVT